MCWYGPDGRVADQVALTVPGPLLTGAVGQFPPGGLALDRPALPKSPAQGIGASVMRPKASRTKITRTPSGVVMETGRPTDFVPVPVAPPAASRIADT